MLQTEVAAPRRTSLWEHHRLAGAPQVPFAGVGTKPLYGRNRRVRSDLSAVNRDPYGDGWLVDIRLSDPDEVALLFDADAHRAQAVG